MPPKPPRTASATMALMTSSPRSNETGSGRSAFCPAQVTFTLAWPGPKVVIIAAFSVMVDSPSPPKPTYEELEANASTQAHIDLVRRLLRAAAFELIVRGEVHDRSKFSPEEVDMFARFTPRLRGMTYDSPEYRACLAEMKAHGGLQHHYANNRHHPEFFADGIDGMDLFDVLEMFVDWAASTRRHADGDIMSSIEKNRARFGMSDQLVSIFRNTVRNFSPELTDGRPETAGPPSLRQDGVHVDRPEKP